MKKNILLVDDESSLRRSLYLSLTQEGYFIEPCENGVNAIRKLQLYEQNNKHFNTIVLDIKLPDIDGIKLGKIFKSKYPDSNIIFITGYTDNINLYEIQNFSDTRLLEKPFSTKDLTEKIEELNMAKNISATLPLLGDSSASHRMTEEETKIKTFSAYAILKIEKDADFFKIYRQLYFDKDVLYCDATKGDYDIFLLVQSSSYAGCKEICDKKVRIIEGVRELEYYEISSPILDNGVMNIIDEAGKLLSSVDSYSPKRDFHNVVCSYILVEVEREKLDNVFTTLYFDDNVVHCDYTDSKYSMFLLVQGTQFSEIDELIKNKIATLDGVLKVREYPIITIFEM
jgi:CheY-like chemotaxis protein